MDQRILQIIQKHPELKSEFEELYPELTESEDERIRKGLLKVFKQSQNGYWAGMKIKDIVAYLEKRKEQKPNVEYVYPKFRVGDEIVEVSPNGSCPPVIIKYNMFEEVEQQEQPEGLHFIPLNRLIQKIPSENWNDTVNNYAKKLCNCLIKEVYRKDAVVLQGYISYMNGNNVSMATMDEQEQPGVDLEKEIENEWRKCCPTDEGMGLESANIVKEQFDAIVYYFYKLGINARKEK